MPEVQPTFFGPALPANENVPLSGRFLGLPVGLPEGAISLATVEDTVMRVNFTAYVGHCGGLGPRCDSEATIRRGPVAEFVIGAALNVGPHCARAPPAGDVFIPTGWTQAGSSTDRKANRKRKVSRELA